MLCYLKLPGKSLSIDYRMLNTMKKDIETMKNNQSNKECKSAIYNTLEGINSRLDEAEDWIRDLEDKVEKTPK